MVSVPKALPGRRELAPLAMHGKDTAMKARWTRVPWNQPMAGHSRRVASRQPIAICRSLDCKHGTGVATTKSAQNTLDDTDTPHSLWATGGTSSPYHSGMHSLLKSGTLPEEKEIILVRHGQSTWNVEGRIQGSTDISTLTERGREQAKLVRDAVCHIPFDSCFSSPITRARASAEIIWGGRGTDIVFLDDLKEADLLTLQGMKNVDAAVEYPELFTTWRETPHLFCVDGVYPVKHQWTRAASAWETILSSPGSLHLVITHKSILRAMVCTALGLPPAGFRAIDIHNSGVTRIRVNKQGEPMLTNLNLTTHMNIPNVKY